jgi:plastocyanin
MMQAEGTVKVITVEGSNFKFLPATITVNKGDTVKITFKNTGGFHDFVIDEFEGAKTKQIGANSEETIQFVADKAGTFEYYCSVGNHRGMGMVGKLIVQ